MEAALLIAMIKPIGDGPLSESVRGPSYVSAVVGRIYRYSLFNSVLEMGLREVYLNGAETRSHEHILFPGGHHSGTIHLLPTCQF